MQKFISIPNTPDAPEVIKQMRIAAKRVGVIVAVRGRCKQRKAVFAVTGRYYSTHSANTNDIYLGQPEAKYCHSWAIYLRNKF